LFVNPSRDVSRRSAQNFDKGFPIYGIPAILAPKESSRPRDRKTRPIFERGHKRPQRIFARLMGGAWMRARTQRNEIDRKPLITQETAKRLIQRSQCFQRLKGSPAKRFISLRETKSLCAQPERRARRLRKSALKPLKSFARATLCAAAPFKIALALAKRAAPPLPARRFAGKPGAPRQFSV
jgi:hypothetical protein